MNKRVFRQHSNILQNVRMLSSSQFKGRVLEVVTKIPRGKTLSYKEVARRAGNPQAARAVGNIMNKNYDPKIPCHRVIRSDGSIGGYRGGTKRKVEILKREGAIFA